MDRLTPDTLIARLITETALSMANLAAPAHEPRRPWHRRPAPTTVAAADLKALLRLPGGSGYRQRFHTWPDGTSVTPGEALLLEWVHRLPRRYGNNPTDDLVLDWAAATLHGTGWTLETLARWAAPHLPQKRTYPTCPTATVLSKS